LRAIEAAGGPRDIDDAWKVLQAAERAVDETLIQNIATRYGNATLAAWDSLRARI
jgi:hypothetical protein